MNSLFPPIVRTILLLNVALFALTQFMAGMGIDLTAILAMHYPGSPDYRHWQWVTHFFMHGNFSHIFSNLLALWMFGAPLENYWGKNKFMAYYFITAFGAALLHLGVQAYTYEMYNAKANDFKQEVTFGSFQKFLHDSKTGNYGFKVDGDAVTAMDYADLWATDKGNPQMANHAREMVNIISEQKLNERNTPVLGASGAVFGLLLAFGMIYPNQYVFIGFLIPMQAKYFVALYGFWELYRGMQNAPGDNVAHFAHLGGMLFGFILLWLWKKKSRKPWL